MKMATGAWGTTAVERVQIKEMPLINEVHIDGLVSTRALCQQNYIVKKSNRVLCLENVT